MIHPPCSPYDAEHKILLVEAQKMSVELKFLVALPLVEMISIGFMVYWGIEFLQELAMK